MRKVWLIISVLFCVPLAHAQLGYAGKVEAGYLKFQNHTVRVDPGPDWKGYNLQDEQSGVAFNVINGIRLSRLFAGVGVGYMNFEGVNGVSLFVDANVAITKTRLIPFIDARAGYSHIWNQYNGGTGSSLVEGGVGLKYKFTGKISLYMQTGLLLTQQSLLFPLRLGISY